jgi:hypothetical protein
MPDAWHRVQAASVARALNVLARAAGKRQNSEKELLKKMREGKHQDRKIDSKGRRVTSSAAIAVAFLVK